MSSTELHGGEATGKRLAVLALAALGVVYGDIGTSPLYAVKEVFAGNHPIPVTEANIFGSLSLFFWALIIVVSIKYVSFIMRADNRGEGGIMALIALALREVQDKPKQAKAVMIVGILGAAMFYGDGMVTPAISVLSAVEGLEVATPAFKPFVIPITIVVLFGLFYIQRHGTALVGNFFGPVMVLWFSTLALLGLSNIVAHPAILHALNPLYGVEFLFDNKAMALVAMGNVVLAVTGAEALYADMGHFGRKPIQRAWFAFVLPALVLNYFGQGALIYADPEAAKNPFFLSAPEWALYPLVGLATVATVIASQAVISGAFSVTRQAMQLGFVPRMEVQQTSEKEQGQIYLPAVNWALMLAVMILVLGFRSSNNLAAAYGIAVTGDMVITSLLATVVVARGWGWGWARASALFACFLVVELMFLAANILKIPDGGWFPLVAGMGTFILMTTWKRGRLLLAERLEGRAPGTLAISGIACRIDADPGGGHLGIPQCRSQWGAACPAAQPDAQQGAARAGGTGFRPVLRRALRPGCRPGRGQATARQLLERDHPVRLQGRTRHSAGLVDVRRSGARIQCARYVLLHRPRDPDSPAQFRDGVLAREAVRGHVPQWRFGNGILQDSQQPGGRTGHPGGALVSAGSGDYGRFSWPYTAPRRHAELRCRWCRPTGFRCCRCWP